MLRTGAAGILRRTAATRPWTPSVAARWSARYQSTTPPPPSSNAPPASSSAADANPGPSSKSASKPTEAKVSQAMLAKDAKTDELLNKALLEALEDIQNENTLDAELSDSISEPPVTVQGYDGPVLPDPVPPNSKYDPTTLPLTQPLSSAYDPLTGPPSSSLIGGEEEVWHATLVRGRSVAPAYHHKPLYHIPAASIHFRSYQQKLLDFYCHFATHAAASLGIPVSKVVRLPTQRSLWTVPRSPFAHKKSQENFERRTHKRVVKAWDAHPDVVDKWVQYLRQHAVGGVGMRVTTWRRLPLGYGQKRVEEVKGRLADLPAQKIKGLADKIVKEELAAAGKKPAAASVQAP